MQKWTQISLGSLKLLGLILLHLLFFSLHSDRKFKKQVNPASAKAEYDLAAELGLASRNQVICRQRYASCPYTSDEMMGALRNSHL